MQFLYVQNLGHRDPVSFVFYIQGLLHTAILAKFEPGTDGHHTHSYTKTNYVQTPGEATRSGKKR